MKKFDTMSSDWKGGGGEKKWMQCRMKGDEKLRMRNGDSMKGRRRWFAENLG